MPDQKLGSLYYTVGIQGMQSFLKDTNALRKQIVDIAHTPVKSLLAAIDIPDVAQMQRTLNVNRTNTINALRTALGSGTLNRSQTAVATRALDFIKADSAATIGLFQALQQQRRAFSEKIGGSAEELRSIQTMIKAGESSGEITKGSGFANNLRATAAHATIVKSSMEGVNDAILRGDAALAKSYDTYQRSGKSAADFERLAAATAKHKVNESLAVEKSAHKEAERIAAAKKNSAEFGEFEFDKMSKAEAAGSASQLLVDARRRTRQYVTEQVRAGNTFVETDPAVLRARKQNAIDAEATDRSNRLDALLTGSRDRLAGAERTYEAGPKTRAAQDTLNQEALRYGIEERRARDRVAAERRLEEHDLESSMPRSSDENRVRNAAADLDEKLLHIASRRADIEQAVNNTLGTQVSYAEKIAMAEKTALDYATQRSKTPLSPEQEAAIKKGARSAEEANLIGGVGGSAQKNLEDAKTRLKNLQDARAGATAENAPLIDKAIRETRALIDLEARRLRIAQELAVIENKLATDPSLTHGSRRRLEKSAAHYREELKAANVESENSGRSMAKDKSKLSNYRLQELSYGVQDFAQVLSGGGGLEAALRAANNNISQFYAAAGGANAARNSMVATMAVLGIAAAMKFLADQADLPIKRLEEFNEKLKKLQSTNTEIARIMGSGATRLGDISGESGIGSGKAMADMGLALRNKRDLLGNEVDIFGGRQKVGALEQMGGVFRTVVAENLDFMGSAAGLFSGAAGDYFKKGADEYRNTVAGSVLGQAFSDRFVDKKSISEVSLPAVMTGQQKKYFSAILGSKDTSTESAIKAFKEIDEGGGWRDVPKEEIEPFRESVRLLDEQIKKIAAAAKSFEFSLSAMGDNLRQRNSLLANAGSQRRLAASTEDVRFINEQNAMATQLERDAKALREEGLVKEAERAEKEAESRRRVAAVRAGNMAPGGGAMLTSQAAAFEDTLSPFVEARAAAQKMLAEAQNPTGRAGALTQLHNIGLNEADTLRKQSMSFAFSGQQANESFTEADQRLSETYKQMAKSIAGRARDNGDAADEAKAKLDSAIAREKAMLDASRKFESSSRSARAFGTRFDEQRAALEKSNAEEVARIKRDFGGKGQEADLKRELGLAEESRKRQSREIAKQKERAMQDAAEMLSGQTAGMGSEIEGRRHANSEQLKLNLRSIEDARAAKLITEEEANQRRKEAQDIFDKASKRDEARNVSDRMYESESRFAKAYEASFEERRASLERQRREELANAEKEHEKNPEELRRQRKMINDGINRQLNDNLRDEARSKADASTMFAGQAASLIGGREGQHYANAKQLEANLRAIEDAKAADPGITDAEVEKKRREAQSIFEEQKKQIEHKQVGFSDIGGMWKQIQMSLKPDKSIEMQRIANDHLDQIRTMAQGSGLKVQISLSP